MSAPAWDCPAPVYDEAEAFAYQAASAQQARLGRQDMVAPLNNGEKSLCLFLPVRQSFMEHG
jgi:hypothetical protein